MPKSNESSTQILTKLATTTPTPAAKHTKKSKGQKSAATALRASDNLPIVKNELTKSPKNSPRSTQSVSSNIMPSEIKQRTGWEDYVQKASRLTEVEISNKSINSNESQQLAAALKKNKGITSVKFTHIDFTDKDSLKNLVAALLETKGKLESFCIDYRHPIERESEGAEIAGILALLLGPESTLKNLVIEHVNIGDDGIEALTRALRENNQLQKLTLYDVEFGTKGAKLLLKMYKNNNVFTSISVSFMERKIEEKLGPIIAEIKEENIKRKKSAEKTSTIKSEEKINTKPTMVVSPMLLAPPRETSLSSTVLPVTPPKQNTSPAPATEKLATSTSFRCCTIL